MNFELYLGTGESIAKRNLELPPYDNSPLADAPQLYFAKKGLRDAVNIALFLGQPLLVTGEPGTGKTQLAYSIAYELGNLPVHRFNTKSTSTAKELFYRYDALRHFHDAQFERRLQSGSEKEKLSAEAYITFEALGLAILLSLDKNNDQRQRVNNCLPGNLRDSYNTRSIVLIDEIDKAPRDLPNDILNEIEEMSFEVKEIDSPEFIADKQRRPILILTSNSEKNLPDAFLRRCIFYHIDFPNTADLKKIVTNRLGKPAPDVTSDLRINAIEHFQRIRRELKLKKPPATAELLAWIRVLERMKIDVGNENLSNEEKEALIFTYSVLTKTAEDSKTLRKELHSNIKTNSQSLASVKATSPNE